MADVTILVRAGQLVPAHAQLAIPNGAVAIAGETIEAIGTYDVVWDQFFLGLNQLPRRKRTGHVKE